MSGHVLGPDSDLDLDAIWEYILNETVNRFLLANLADSCIVALPIIWWRRYHTVERVWLEALQYSFRITFVDLPRDPTPRMSAPLV